MFDDKEPQDIFAGTDNAPPPAGLPVEPAAQRTPPPVITRPVVRSEPVMTAPAMDDHPRRGGALKTVIIIIVALIVIGVGAYLTYAFMMKSVPAVVVPDTTTPSTETPDTTLPDGTDTTETPDNTLPDNNTNQGTFLDSDGDGLTNAQELEAGTSSTNSDTDGDGLGDREEVQVYGTDPRRTDTDGDGFLDGAEVQSGYNPNGPGKLVQIPTP